MGMKIDNDEVAPGYKQKKMSSELKSNAASFNLKSETNVL